MEVNPGTVEANRFSEYKAVGINRLSIGVQSFNDKYLKLLGRIHTSREAEKAISICKRAGFKNFNLIKGGSVGFAEKGVGGICLRVCS